jgi:hypothetical protein
MPDLTTTEAPATRTIRPKAAVADVDFGLKPPRVAIPAVRNRFAASE